MKTLSVIVAGLFTIGLLSLVGCGKSELVTQAEELAEKACACKDIGCYSGVIGEFAKWGAANKDKKVTKGDQEKIEAAGEKLKKCAEKLAAGAAGGGDKKE